MDNYNMKKHKKTVPFLKPDTVFLLEREGHLLGAALINDWWIFAIKCEPLRAGASAEPKLERKEWNFSFETWKEKFGSNSRSQCLVWRKGIIIWEPDRIILIFI